MLTYGNRTLQSLPVSWLVVFFLVPSPTDLVVAL